MPVLRCEKIRWNPVKLTLNEHNFMGVKKIYFYLLTISEIMCENYLSHCSDAAALLVEDAALVLAFTPLGGVVPVHLLITHVPERSSKPGRAGSSGPVAQPVVPVEADVHEGRLLLGGRLRELARRLLLGQLGLRPS